MKVKKLTAVILSALLLTGCGAVDPEPEKVPQQETTTAENTEQETEPESVLEFRVGLDPETEPVLTNEHIEYAAPMIVNDSDGAMIWVVSLNFNSEGAAIFEETTRELAGTDTPISIWLDGELISSPTVASTIVDGKAVISGNFDESSATELANNLKKGDNNEESDDDIIRGGE